MARRVGDGMGPGCHVNQNTQSRNLLRRGDLSRDLKERIFGAKASQAKGTSGAEAPRWDRTGHGEVAVTHQGVLQFECQENLSLGLRTG